MKSLQFSHKYLKGKEVLVDFNDTIQTDSTTYVRCYVQYIIPKKYVSKENLDIVKEKGCLYLPITWVRFVRVCPWRLLVSKLGHPKPVQLNLFEFMSMIVHENVHYGGRSYQFG